MKPVASNSSSYCPTTSAMAEYRTVSPHLATPGPARIKSLLTTCPFVSKHAGTQHMGRISPTAHKPETYERRSRVALIYLVCGSVRFFLFADRTYRLPSSLCNNKKTPVIFSRKGRFSERFFADSPTLGQQLANKQAGHRREYSYLASLKHLPLFEPRAILAPLLPQFLRPAT